VWGLLYVITKDLVDWVMQSEYVANRTNGPEDELLGLWLKKSKLVTSWIRDKDYQLLEPPHYKDPASYSAGKSLTKNVIAVHPLKKDEWFRNTTTFFMSQFSQN
jgi:hypothetical protein